MSAGVSRRARVVVVTTHPVQYHVPWLRGLAMHPGLDLHVLYGMLPTDEQQGVGFGVAFRWDQDLLEGYPSSTLENVACRPELGRWSGINAPGVGDRLSRLGAEVVIVTGWQSRSLVQATWACMRQSIPVLVRGDSNSIRKRRWWVRAIQRAYIRQFAGALVVGASNRNFYVQLGLPKDRCFWVPHFVPTDHLRPYLGQQEGVRRAARRRFGAGTGTSVILYCGKLLGLKRIDTLIGAVARLYAQGEDVLAVIVGEGPAGGPLRDLARDLRAPVMFAGFLNQMEIGAAYAAADMFILPSASEAWGLVVNEAQVCGLPVVVSDQVGCGPDLVEDGVTGWTYPCGDVPALAERIRGLARDPALRQRMGEAGRQRVAAYSVEAAVAGTVQAVEAVLARREAKATLRA